MKTLPFALGTLALACTFITSVSAQNGFNSSPLPNASPFGGLHTAPRANFAPAPPPPYSPAGAAAYGAAPAPGAYPVPSAAPVDPNHKLGRGDRLSFRVVEDRDDKVWPLYVTDSGDVDVPLIGRVRAAGKSTEQLQADIKGQLEREYYYHATVIMGLDNVAPLASKGRVYVTGAVRAEGAVELPTDEPLTVSKAIARVGGFRDFGSKVVKVQRRGGPKGGISVDVGAVNKGAIDKDIVLQPEDIIVVREKVFNF